MKKKKIFLLDTFDDNSRADDIALLIVALPWMIMMAAAFLIHFVIRGGGI